MAAVVLLSNAGPKADIRQIPSIHQQNLKIFGSKFISNAPRLRTRVAQPSTTCDNTEKEQISRLSPSAHSSNDTLPAQDTGITPELEQHKFSWTQCWYPVTSLDSLDPAVPLPITILGYDLVIWQDSEGQWRCFRDACPHRAAPLSEGAINPKTKCLQCAYHGFEFSGSGKCTAIPQSPQGPAFVTATAAPRSAATAYPTATAHGLLWVWLQPGEAGKHAASAFPLPEVPAKDANGVEWFQVSSWYVREMPVDYVALMENSADPSHVHFTHAGFIGGPERAGPISVNTISTDGKNQFVFACDDPKRATFRNLMLSMPCMLWASSEGMPGGELGLLYFIIPVSPGKSRLMSLPLSTSPKFRLPAKIFHAAPWLRHLFNHTVAAQDIAILHRQGTNMAAEDFPGWKRGFYMPTGADKGISVLRKWLEAAGGVKFGPNVNANPIREAVRNREELFDNYNSHTLNCPSCKSALRRVRAAGWLAKVVAAATVVAAAAAVGAAGAVGSRRVLALGLAGIVAWSVSVAMGKLESGFLHTHWKHSENKKLLQGSGTPSN